MAGTSNRPLFSTMNAQRRKRLATVLDELRTIVEDERTLAEVRKLGAAKSVQKLIGESK